MFENIHWPTVVFVGLMLGIGVFIVMSRRTVNKNITMLSADEFANVMRKGQLIDIRKKVDFDTGHINGARNIPLVMLNKSLSKLRTDQPIYLVCADGKTCKRATAILVAKHYNQIFGLEGGLANWQKPLKTK